MYLWIKAFHIITVVTWFAGLFYLPRLFVYHAMAKDDPVGIDRFKTMERKLYFGIMNGGPSQSALGGQNPGATANIEIEFTGINSQNQGVDWGVQNDPSLQPTNCKSSKGTGNDCYTWDAVSKKGKAEWAWKDGKTSGGMIGPLPSYDFCAILKRGDVKGIDTYEFASSFNDVSKETVGSGSFQSKFLENQFQQVRDDITQRLKLSFH